MGPKPMVGDDRTGFSPDDRIRSSQRSSQRKTQTSTIISQSHLSQYKYSNGPKEVNLIEIGDLYL